jgi:2-polyprenyl-3-methyl-5-hydroxy-6-metoxy-1,4-benzoquinol methylase/8-oxo-dGTP pyrophosphatase MutT (NUDIX family)
MKYYYREHNLGYRKIKAEGKTAWAEIHGHIGFENFSSRAFLEAALPQLRLPVPRPTALEVGCGTGPGACFLAERGFQVDAIDLIPMAIEMARELAQERNLDIHYDVQDICELPHRGKHYDVIVDSFCLQCIVTDADRQSVFSSVRTRLKPSGYYLISTAMFDPGRFRAEERVWDAETGIVYNRYGDGIIDAATGIAYQTLDDKVEDYPDAINIEDMWYLPSRRHLTAPALRAELQAAGFSVLSQDELYGGNVICVREAPAEKVIAYITHAGRLLVFSHPHHPEAGIQVPGGTIEGGELPEDAVLREAQEETGLTGLEIRSYLGVRELELSTDGRAEIRRRHFFHLALRGEAPDRWCHFEEHPSDGSSEPIEFELFWVRYPEEVPELSGGQGELLHRLTPA